MMNETTIDPSLLDEEVADVEDVQEEFVEEEVEESPQPEAKPASAQDVATIVAEAMGRMQQQQPAQQPVQQLSEEEIQKRLKVAKFDEQFATQMHQALVAEDFNPQAVVGLLTDLRDRLMDQANTFAQLSILQQQQEWEKKFNPLVEAQQNQRAQQTRERFYKSYQTLKPFEQLMPIAASNVAQSGKKFANENEEFKALAEEAEKLIKAVNPQFRLGQARSGGPKPASMMRSGQVGAGDSKPATRTNGADPSLL